MWATVTNQPSNMKPKTVIPRLVYTIALLFGVIFIGILNVFLLDQMTRSLFYNQINTFEKMQYSNLKLIASKSAMDILRNINVSIYIVQQVVLKAVCFY